MSRSFYYLESRHGEKIQEVLAVYEGEPHFSLNDGSLLIYTHSFSVMLEDFKCGMGDQKDIVEKAKDPELEKWYKDLMEIIRRRSSKAIRERY